MKYIKTYENKFNHYEIIGSYTNGTFPDDQRKVVEYMFERVCDFSNKNLNSISNELNKLGIEFNLEKNNGIGGLIDYTGHHIIFNIKDKESDSFDDVATYKIFECTDEWFLVYKCDQQKGFVKNNLYYYKCDQLEGLLIFLNDKFLPNRIVESWFNFFPLSSIEKYGTNMDITLCFTYKEELSLDYNKESNNKIIEINKGIKNEDDLIKLLESGIIKYSGSDIYIRYENMDIFDKNQSDRKMIINMLKNYFIKNTANNLDKLFLLSEEMNKMSSDIEIISGTTYLSDNLDKGRYGNPKPSKYIHYCDVFFKNIDCKNIRKVYNLIK